MNKLALPVFMGTMATAVSLSGAAGLGMMKAENQERGTDASVGDRLGTAAAATASLGMLMGGGALGAVTIADVAKGAQRGGVAGKAAALGAAAAIAGGVLGATLIGHHMGQEIILKDL